MAVTRNETTTAAILAVASAIFVDPRVQMLFTVAPDRSAFALDLEASLHARGLLVAPWDQVTNLPVDLVVAASYAGAPLDVCAPVLFLPHGYGRTRDGSAGEPPRPGDLVVGQRVVHCVPHESAIPSMPAWGEKSVVGDTIYDSLTYSCEQIPQIRASLGVAAEKRLVVLTSTWGPNSLFATRPGVFEEALGALPTDEYVVAAILHANVWTGHGRWQTRTWLQPALDAGLRLIPFEEGWRPAIAAADAVIGDHGSVTFYADLLGRPTLRAFGNVDELTPGTPLAQQVRAGARLRKDDSLRDALDAARAPSQASVRRLVGASVDHAGSAHARLREVAYDLMKLAVPPDPPRGYRSPLPQISWAEPGTYWASLSESARPTQSAATGSEPSMTLVRTAATGSGTGRTAPGVLGRVTVARLDLARPVDAEHASILLVGPARRPTAASLLEAMTAALRRHPASVCVVHGSEQTVTVLMRHQAGPATYRVGGIPADDDRATTAAGLYALAESARGDQPDRATATGDKATVRFRCAQLRWEMAQLDHEEDA